MVLFVVANVLFVLVRMIAAVPSVSVPIIFARQLFVVVLSLYVIRPPPCADLRLIHIIAVITLVSCRMFLVSSLRVTIVALRISQMIFWIPVIVHCSTFARFLVSISFRDTLLSIHCDYLANAIR